MRGLPPLRSYVDRTRLAIPLVAALLGLLMVFGEMFASGLALYPSDPADPRYSEYVFEHSWRWIRGEVTGGYFDLPMGFPVPNMGAYSEPLLSFAPYFWLFRAIGFSSSSSHQLWMVLVAALNFAAFYLLMRRSLRLDPLASSAAAFLFAFGLPRVAQIGHSQLWPQFYIVGVLWGLHAMLAEGTSEHARSWALPAVVAGFVLQAWGCLYNAVFLAYACFAFGLFSLLHAPWRVRGWKALKSVRPAGAVCIAVALVALVPLLAAYLPIASQSVEWNAKELYLLKPRLGSLVYVGELSWFYGWMKSHTALGRLPALHEQALGIGLLTTMVVLYTLTLHWRKPVVRVIAGVIAVLWLPALVWPGGQTLWTCVHVKLPGLNALRAIGRLGLLLLIPASAALGVFVHSRRESRRPLVTVAIGQLCVLEQGSTIRTFAKQPFEEMVAAIAKRVDPNAEAFFFVGDGFIPPWLSHVDAILASQRAGVPTINMYAARSPADYKGLAKSSAKNPQMLPAVERDLSAWIDRHGLDSDRVQRILQYEFWPPSAWDDAARRAARERPPLGPFR